MKTETINTAGWKKKINSIFNLWTILSNDVTRALHETDRASEDDKAYRRRTLVRTFFACVEGVCFGMRSFCDEAVALPGIYQLDVNLLKKLREERAVFIDAVKISFKCYAEIFVEDFSLNTNGKNYEAFLNSKKLRDRLMHPKRDIDLLISSNEIKEIESAIKWFNEEMVRLSKCPIGKKLPVTK